MANLNLFSVLQNFWRKKTHQNQSTQVQEYMIRRNTYFFNFHIRIHNYPHVKTDFKMCSQRLTFLTEILKYFMCLQKSSSECLVSQKYQQGIEWTLGVGVSPQYFYGKYGQYCQGITGIWAQGIFGLDFRTAFRLQHDFRPGPKIHRKLGPIWI